MSLSCKMCHHLDTLQLEWYYVGRCLAALCKLERSAMEPAACVTTLVLVSPRSLSSLAARPGCTNHASTSQSLYETWCLDGDSRASMRDTIQLQASRDPYLCACGVNPCSGCCWWSDGSPLREDAAQESTEDIEPDVEVHFPCLVPGEPLRSPRFLPAFSARVLMPHPCVSTRAQK